MTKACSKSGRVFCKVNMWRSRLAWSRARDWKSRNGHKPFESSNLSFSATSSQAAFRLRRLFMLRIKSHLALIPLLLLSAKGPARLACSVVNALATARCRYQLFAGCEGSIPTGKTPKISFLCGFDKNRQTSIRGLSTFFCLLLSPDCVLYWP